MVVIDEFLTVFSVVKVTCLSSCVVSWIWILATLQLGHSVYCCYFYTLGHAKKTFYTLWLHLGHILRQQYMLLFQQSIMCHRL